MQRCILRAIFTIRRRRLDGGDWQKGEESSSIFKSLHFTIAPFRKTRKSLFWIAINQVPGPPELECV
jgi:hypothetical protein